MNTSLVGGLNLVVDSKEIMGLVEKFKKYAKKNSGGSVGNGEGGLRG